MFPSNRHAITAAALAAALATTGCERRMSTLRLIPEPTLQDVMRERYAVDEAATADAIAERLAGMAFADVQDLLRAEETTFRVTDDSTVTVVVRHGFAPMPVAYSCLVEVTFADGRVSGVRDIYACGLDTP